MRAVRIACLLAGLLGTAPAWAKTPVTPLQLPGATVVTAEKVRELTSQGAVLVDARVGHEYASEHIRGAVSIPYKEHSAKHVNYDASKDSFDLSRLPKDRKAAVIFYCNAGECWKSYKASRAALKAGYSRVYWLRGGIPEWKEKGLPVE
ncbi:MAG: rhodanese [Candidatus Muproteobacteria bacterium RBG_16_62_13]|uniref:Rhodanese n=1 Tax=Candidatus Muproteobacteria bacterium RBG_16_62_13 TaxID=1817756 RepID=A0A1F6T363_9PROT|nr:MAG: rhodanese [Candidatus Muproteobacteria bacterium RBG_16_62_13]